MTFPAPRRRCLEPTGYSIILYIFSQNQAAFIFRTKQNMIPLYMHSISCT